MSGQGCANSRKDWMGGEHCAMSGNILVCGGLFDMSAKVLLGEELERPLIGR